MFTMLICLYAWILLMEKHIWNCYDYYISSSIDLSYKRKLSIDNMI